MRRSCRNLAAVAILTATAALTGCGDDINRNGPLSGLDPEEGVQIANLDAHRSPTWSYGSFVVCLDDAGEPVTIDEIDAVRIGGVELVSVAAKAATGEMIASARGGPPPSYLPAAGFEVAEQCAAEGVELVLELRPPTTGSSAIDGFTVRYSRGDERYEVGYAARILLCDGDDVAADADVLAPCADDGI